MGNSKLYHADFIPQGVLRGLDVIVAILLLTGQISIGGVFFAGNGFALSLSGALTGAEVLTTDLQASWVLEGLDVIAAFLLILDEVHVVGTYVTASRFTIVISGPPFGVPLTEGYLPRTKEFFRDFRDFVLNKYDI